MRITNAYFWESQQRAIAAAQERYFQANQQISTGKKLNTPSDDPVGAELVLNFSSVRSALTQYDKNINLAKGWLGFTDTALDESTLLMRRANELAILGANAATDQVARDGMVSEITEIQKRLLALANSRGADGRYIFAGQSWDTAPFSISGSTLAYNGDNNPINVEAGPGQVIQVNTVSTPLFIGAYDALENLKNNLGSGNIYEISNTDLAALQKSISEFIGERGALGAKMQTIEALSAQHGRRTDELSSQISNIEDVDLSEAITKFRLAETAYQAALSATSQGFRLSLLDFI